MSKQLVRMLVQQIELVWNGCLCSGPAFLHDQHLLADARPDRIDRDERDPARLSLESQRLHQQQRRAFELLVLLGRDDGPDHSADLHQAKYCGGRIDNCGTYCSLRIADRVAFAVQTASQSTLNNQK